MGRLLSLLSAICWLVGVSSILAATAQVPATATPDNSKQASAGARIAYFLIDASGSMANKNVEADVGRIQSELVSADPTILISRTYFRAADRAACWAPIEIAGPVPASDSFPTVQQFSADFTPLGQALRSAILRAGNVPTDIFIFSDESQTQDCGPDICAVASSMLPRDGLNVHLIPSRESSPADHDRLGCIEGIQGKPPALTPIAEVAVDADEPNSENPSESEVEPNLAVQLANGTVQFFEYWMWLIGFVLVAYAAYRYGSKHFSHAVAFEGHTADVQSLQGRITQGDDAAKGELDKLIAKVAQDAKADPDANENRKVENVVRYTGTIGGGVLAAIAFLPDLPPVFGFKWSAVKSSAWVALNSEFATAFAVIWISIVFFAASQRQRHMQALRNYRIATKEAESIAEAKRSQLQRQAYSDYLRSFELVDGYLPAAPIADFEVTMHDEPDPDATLYEAVRRRAVDSALGQKLTANSSVLELINADRRLQYIAQRMPMWLPARKHFAEYIRRLVLHDVLANTSSWTALQKAIEAGQGTAIREAIRELAKVESIESQAETPRE